MVKTIHVTAINPREFTRVILITTIPLENRKVFQIINLELPLDL